MLEPEKRIWMPYGLLTSLLQLVATVLAMFFNTSCPLGVRCTGQLLFPHKPLEILGDVDTEAERVRVSYKMVRGLL